MDIKSVHIKSDFNACSCKEECIKNLEKLAHLLEQSGQACVRAEEAEDRAQKAEREIEMHRQNWLEASKAATDHVIKVQRERDEAREQADRIRRAWIASSRGELTEPVTFPWEIQETKR